MEIDNQKLKATVGGRKGGKRGGGGIRERKKNNGERGNEATVVRDWHMSQCGREGEELLGVMTKAV